MSFYFHILFNQHVYVFLCYFYCLINNSVIHKMYVKNHQKTLFQYYTQFPTHIRLVQSIIPFNKIHWQTDRKQPTTHKNHYSYYVICCKYFMYLYSFIFMSQWNLWHFLNGIDRHTKLLCLICTWWGFLMWAVLYEKISERG